MYAPQRRLAHFREQQLPVKRLSELPVDAAIAFRTVDGFVTGEAVLIVTRAGSATPVTADVVTNAPHRSGFHDLLMRLVGFTGNAPSCRGQCACGWAKS